MHKIKTILKADAIAEGEANYQIKCSLNSFKKLPKRPPSNESEALLQYEPRELSCKNPKRHRLFGLPKVYY
jgi:hypothetical protein